MIKRQKSKSLYTCSTVTGATYMSGHLLCTIELVLMTGSPQTIVYELIAAEILKNLVEPHTTVYEKSLAER
jgi:hypothetical protein